MQDEGQNAGTNPAASTTSSTYDPSRAYEDLIRLVLEEPSVEVGLPQLLQQTLADGVAELPYTTQLNLDRNRKSVQVSAFLGIVS